LYNNIEDLTFNHLFDTIVLTGTPDSQVLFNKDYANNLNFLKSFIKRLDGTVSLFELTNGALIDGEEEIYETILRDIDDTVYEATYTNHNGIAFTKFELILGDDNEQINNGN